jgi:type IV pilus assembly protein PilN
MANINLLPWREHLREERKKQFFVQLGVAAVVAALVIFILNRLITSSIDTQNAVNTYLRDEIAVLDKKIVEIRQLQEQKKTLTARMKVIQDLQGNRPVIVRLFDELVRTLPEGVYYNSITRTNDSISIEGVADSNNRVSALMRSLEESEWFAEPDLRQVSALPSTNKEASAQGGSSNSFQLIVKVTTPTKEL